MPLADTLDEETASESPNVSNASGEGPLVPSSPSDAEFKPTLYEKPPPKPPTPPVATLRLPITPENDPYRFRLPVEKKSGRDFLTGEKIQPPMGVAPDKQAAYEGALGRYNAERMFDQQQKEMRQINVDTRQDLQKSHVATQTNAETDQVEPVRDAEGNIQYRPGKGPVQYDAAGKAVQTQYSETGPTRVELDKNADIGTHPDRPNELYKKNKHAAWEYLGTVQDGMTSSDKAVQKAAQEGQLDLDKDLHANVAHDLATEVASRALTVQNKVQDFQGKAKTLTMLNRQLDNFDKENPAVNETQGHWFTGGAQPTQTAQTLQEEKKSLQKQITDLEDKGYSARPDEKKIKKFAAPEIEALKEARGWNQSWVAPKEPGELDKTIADRKAALSEQGADVAGDPILSSLEKHKAALGIGQPSPPADAQRKALKYDPVFAPLMAEHDQLQADQKTASDALTASQADYEKRLEPFRTQLDQASAQIEPIQNRVDKLTNRLESIVGMPRIAEGSDPDVHRKELMLRISQLTDPGKKVAAQTVVNALEPLAQELTQRRNEIQPVAEAHDQLQEEAQQSLTKQQEESQTALSAKHTDLQQRFEAASATKQLHQFATAPETNKALVEKPNPNNEQINPFVPGWQYRAYQAGKFVEGLFAPGKESGPLVSPDVARKAVDILSYATPPGLASRAMGGTTLEIQKAVQNKIADALSGFTSLTSLAALPSFLVPGVAQAYAFGVAAQLPEQYGKLKDSIQKNGVLSPETAGVAAELGIQDLMGFLAAKGGHLGRAHAEEIAKKVAPETPPEPGAAGAPVPGGEPSGGGAAPENPPLSRRATPETARTEIDALIPGAQLTAEQLQPTQHALRGLVKISEGQPMEALTSAERSALEEKGPDGGPRFEMVNGKPVITDATLEKVRTIAPETSQILPKSEEAQRQKILTEETKGGEVQSGKEEKNAPEKGQETKGDVLTPKEAGSPSTEAPQPGVPTEYIPPERFESHVLDQIQSETGEPLDAQTHEEISQLLKVAAPAYERWSKAFDTVNATLRSVGGAGLSFAPESRALGISLPDLGRHASFYSDPKSGNALVLHEAAHSVTTAAGAKVEELFKSAPDALKNAMKEAYRTPGSTEYHHAHELWAYALAGKVELAAGRKIKLSGKFLPEQANRAFIVKYKRAFAEVLKFTRDIEGYLRNHGVAEDVISQWKDLEKLFTARIREVDANAEKSSTTTPEKPATLPAEQAGAAGPRAPPPATGAVEPGGGAAPITGAGAPAATGETGGGLEPAKEVAPRTASPRAGTKLAIAENRALVSEVEKSLPAKELANITARDLNKQLELPKAATAIRATDLQGRTSVILRKDLRGVNPLHEAGPWAKIEAGTIDKTKKFSPLKELFAQAIAAANPHDYTPALRTQEGEILRGEKGKIHQDIYNAQPDPTLVRALEPEHGFLDQSGNFKTREEVSSALGEEKPMQSEKLRELQTGQPLTAIQEKRTLTDALSRDKNQLQGGSEVSKERNSQTEQNAEAAIQERRVNSSDAWLEAISRNDSQAIRNTAEKLLREQTDSERVLDDLNPARIDVRAPGDYGRTARKETASIGARASQERQQTGQSTEQSGTDVERQPRQGALRSESSQSAAADERGGVPETGAVVERTRLLLRMSNETNRAQRARAVRELLRTAAPEVKNQIAKEVESYAISIQSAEKMGAHQGGDEGPRGAIESGGMGRREQGQEAAGTIGGGESPAQATEVLGPAVAELPQRMQGAIGGIVDGKELSEVSKNLGVSQDAVGRLAIEGLRRIVNQGEQQSAKSITEIAKDATTLEGKQPKDYDKSSTQVTLSKEESQPFKEFAKGIPNNEIYTDPNDPTYGRETEPHVTALYGITHSTPNAAAKAILSQSSGAIHATVGKLSIFEQPNYDVLKADIESPDLHAINEALRESVPFESDFPDYKPHLTIAYLKKGEGAKYVGDTRFEGRPLTFSAVDFRSKDGKKFQIDLTKGIRTPIWTDPLPSVLNPNATDLLAQSIADGGMDPEKRDSLQELFAAAATKNAVPPDGAPDISLEEVSKKVAGGSKVLDALNATQQIIRGVRQSRSIRDLEAMGVLDQATQHVGARTYAPLLVKTMIHEVFGERVNDPQFVQKVGEAITNDNILGGYDTLRTELLALKQKAEPTRAETREATDLARRIDNIEASQDLNALEQSVLTAAKDKDIRAAIGRYETSVTPEMDKYYNEMKGLDPETPRETRGRHFEARVNLLTKQNESRMADFADVDKPLPEMGVSNYRNPDVKRDRFDRRAKLTGDYSDNLEMAMLNSFGHRVNEVTKQRLYTALEESGAGRVLKGGEIAPDEINGEPAGVLEIKRPQTKDGKTQQVYERMLVPRSKVETLRKVLNTDLLPNPSTLLRGLTKAQIFGVADATAHTKNQVSLVANSLGRDSNFKAVTARIPIVGTVQASLEIRSIANQVAKGGPEITAEMAELAKNGMLRNAPVETGAKRWIPANILHENDTAARIFLSRAYDRLVQSGIGAVDTLAGKRAFVMQIGEYNRRLMGKIESSARDWGASPFIVAGRTFNRLGRRLVLGEPGFESTSNAGGAYARGVMHVPLLAGMATAAFVNMLMSGSMTGRKGTPIGAIDLGPGYDDEHGGRKMIDLLQITGVRRGLNGLGLDSIINGIVNGDGVNDVAGKAVAQAIQTNAHPFIGPGPGFLFEAGTGKRLDLRQGWQKNFEARTYDGGKQYLENFRAALKHLNVAAYSLVKPALEGALSAAGVNPPREGKGYAGGIGEAILKSPLSAFGYKEADSPAMQRARTLQQRHLGASTEEQADKGKLHSELIKEARTGNTSSLRQAVRDGTIKEADAKRIVATASTTPFQAVMKTLSLDEGLSAFEKADESEKSQVREVLRKKNDSALDREAITDEDHRRNDATLRGRIAPQASLRVLHHDPDLPEPNRVSKNSNLSLTH